MRARRGILCPVCHVFTDFTKTEENEWKWSWKEPFPKGWKEGIDRTFSIVSIHHLCKTMFYRPLKSFLVYKKENGEYEAFGKFWKENKDLLRKINEEVRGEKLEERSGEAEGEEQKGQGEMMVKIGGKMQYATWNYYLIEDSDIESEGFSFNKHYGWVEANGFQTGADGSLNGFYRAVKAFKEFMLRKAGDLEKWLKPRDPGLDSYIVLQGAVAWKYGSLITAGPYIHLKLPDSEKVADTLELSRALFNFKFLRLYPSARLLLSHHITGAYRESKYSFKRKEHFKPIAVRKDGTLEARLFDFIDIYKHPLRVAYALKGVYDYVKGNKWFVEKYGKYDFFDKVIEMPMELRWEVGLHPEIDDAWRLERLVASVHGYLRVDNLETNYCSNNDYYYGCGCDGEAFKRLDVMGWRYKRGAVYRAKERILTDITRLVEFMLEKDEGRRKIDVEVTLIGATIWKDETKDDSREKLIVRADVKFRIDHEQQEKKCVQLEIGDLIKKIFEGESIYSRYPGLEITPVGDEIICDYLGACKRFKIPTPRIGLSLKDIKKRIMELDDEIAELIHDFVFGKK